MTKSNVILSVVFVLVTAFAAEAKDDRLFQLWIFRKSVATVRIQSSNWVRGLEIRSSSA